MDNKDKEYLMLREEILHLSEIISQTTNFFYAFIATYMAAIVTISNRDTIYIIFMYIVTWPAYLIVLNKAQQMYKIGGYLQVFHERKKYATFKWETNSWIFSKKCTSKNLFSFDWFQSHIRAYHFPFSLVNIAALLLFVAGTYQNRQNLFSIYEGFKTIIFIFLFFTMSVLIHEQKKITTNEYITMWEHLENSTNKSR